MSEKSILKFMYLYVIPSIDSKIYIFFNDAEILILVNVWINLHQNILNF